MHVYNADHSQQHLANERTFLSWLRTSIALIGLGFIVARFGLFLREFGLVVKNTNHPGQFMFLLMVSFVTTANDIRKIL
jgi:putative membrane protein